jgi:hypothetical protein
MGKTYWNTRKPYPFAPPAKHAGADSASRGVRQSPVNAP